MGEDSAEGESVDMYGRRFFDMPINHLSKGYRGLASKVALGGVLGDKPYTVDSYLHLVHCWRSKIIGLLNSEYDHRVLPSLSKTKPLKEATGTLLESALRNRMTIAGNCPPTGVVLDRSLLPDNRRRRWWCCRFNYCPWCWVRSLPARVAKEIIDARKALPDDHRLVLEWHSEDLPNPPASNLLLLPGFLAQARAWRARRGRWWEDCRPLATADRLTLAPALVGGRHVYRWEHKVLAILPPPVTGKRKYDPVDMLAGRSPWPSQARPHRCVPLSDCKRTASLAGYWGSYPPGLLYGPSVLLGDIEDIRPPSRFSLKGLFRDDVRLSTDVVDPILASSEA